MNEQQLAAIRERAEKATPGPWTSGQYRRGGWGRTVFSGNAGLTPPDLAVAFLQIGVEYTTKNSEADAAFIAHARTDIPALLAEIDRLRLALRQIADLADASEPLSVVACRWATEALDADAEGVRA